MAKKNEKQKRFIIHEKLTEGSETTNKIGSYDTYEEACNTVERLPVSRIPFCSIEDTGVIS